MEWIAGVKIKVAIGYGGRGCIFEIMEPIDNPKITADINEYGAYLNDFFDGGTEPPKEIGLYLFDGAAYGFPWGDECYQYKGTFNRIEI